MSQETDDFDALESLLTSARKHAEKMRDRGALRRIRATRSELSEDYAERLAERATFRRLLSDESLDGVRFRWWFAQRKKDTSTILSQADRLMSIEDFRKFIDSEIIKDEERARGPTA